MIHFIESGKGIYNGKVLSGGQAFICRQDQLCHYFPDKEDPWTYTWINVVGKGADWLINSLNAEDNVFYWSRSANLDALKRIWHYDKNEHSQELICISVLYQIFADTAAGKIQAKRDYVGEAKRFFQGGYDRGVTVDEVAFALGISRAYLRNVFYEKTGISPQAYLMSLRMKRAEILLHRDYTITEIAAAVGYTDVLQFSKIFAKHHGMSPTQYRKNLIIK